jgi:hypothetical protein
MLAKVVFWFVHVRPCEVPFLLVSRSGYDGHQGGVVARMAVSETKSVDKPQW